LEAASSPASARLSRAAPAAPGAPLAGETGPPAPQRGVLVGGVRCRVWQTTNVRSSERRVVGHQCRRPAVDNVRVTVTARCCAATADTVSVASSSDSAAARRPPTATSGVLGSAERAPAGDDQLLAAAVPRNLSNHGQPLAVIYTVCSSVRSPSVL